MTSKRWDWTERYERREAEEPLRQGDIVLAAGTALGLRYTRSDRFAVLNQSCDLVCQNEDRPSLLLLPRTRSLIVAPVVPAIEFFSEYTREKLLKSQSAKRVLVWNDAVAAYLPASPEHGVEQDLVIMLEEMYSLELWHRANNGAPDLSNHDEILRSPRIGLSSPWAERLGWMAGCLFARIGTPDPTPDEVYRMLSEISNHLPQARPEAKRGPPG